jgi:hypothetical protein
MIQTQDSNLVIPRKRTRADALRDKVQIRLAVDTAGPLIAEVLKENGVELPGADWSKGVFPSWLIATVDDNVIGCIQVLPAKPVGYCECLFVKPSAPFKLRAIAIRKLIIQGMATLYVNGSAYVGCTPSVSNKKFIDVMMKLNFVKVSDNIMLAKRLAGE